NGGKRRLNVIGKPLIKVDAKAKCIGELKYADDIVLPRMLHTRLLRSTVPHARIVNIDVSKAKAYAGVHAVLLGTDLPTPYGALPVSEDEHPLAIGKVRMVGDPVAAIAAVDEDVATEALDLIQVEYEPLPVVTSIQDAYAIEDRCTNSAVWKQVSPKPTTFGKTSRSMKAARTLLWNNMQVWLSSVMTGNSHSGLPRRTCTICTGTLQKCCKCRRVISA